MSLERFHLAQADRATGYDTALGELRRGRKTSHWIWYIFPQLAGLGRSSAARTYALRDFSETCAYLRDPLLRARYEEIADAVSDQLTRGRPLESLMGSTLDTCKLVSSLTLFAAAAASLTTEDPGFENLAQRCRSLLAQTAAQGHSACAYTLERIKG